MWHTAVAHNTQQQREVGSLATMRYAEWQQSFVHELRRIVFHLLGLSIWMTEIGIKIQKNIEFNGFNPNSGWLNTPIPLSTTTPSQSKQSHLLNTVTHSRWTHDWEMKYFFALHRNIKAKQDTQQDRHSIFDTKTKIIWEKNTREKKEERKMVNWITLAFVSCILGQCVCAISMQFVVCVLVTKGKIGICHCSVHSNCENYHEICVRLSVFVCK